MKTRYIVVVAVVSVLLAMAGMYIVMALAWLYVVDGVALTRWDWAGAALALAGMAIIALQPSTLDPASR